MNQPGKKLRSSLLIIIIVYLSTYRVFIRPVWPRGVARVILSVSSIPAVEVPDEFRIFRNVNQILSWESSVYYIRYIIDRDYQLNLLPTNGLKN